MPVEILTKEDLSAFRIQLLHDIKQILNCQKAPENWLRSSDVRRKLKISAGTLQNMRINGTLRGKQLPNSRIWYYREDEINKLLNED